MKYGVPTRVIAGPRADPCHRAALYPQPSAHLAWALQRTQLHRRFEKFRNTEIPEFDISSGSEENI